MANKKVYDREIEFLDLLKEYPDDAAYLIEETEHRVKVIKEKGEPEIKRKAVIVTTFVNGKPLDYLLDKRNLDENYKPISEKEA